jgi:hypothetical protein
VISTFQPCAQLFGGLRRAVLFDHVRVPRRADAPVVLADVRDVPAVRLPGEPDVVRGLPQVLAPDHDLGADFLTVEQARPAVIPDEGHRPVVHLDLAGVAESLQGVDQAGCVGRLDFHDGEMGHRELPPWQARNWIMGHRKASAPQARCRPSGAV